MDWKKRRSIIADQLTEKLNLDVRFYGRSVSWISLSHVSGVVRGIATTFLMARWLDPVVLGQFRYLLALFGVAGIFSFSGMSSSVIKGISQGDTIVTKIAIHRILQFAPLGSFLLIFAAIERYIHHEPSIGAALLVSAAAFVPYSICSLLGPILLGNERIKYLSVFSLVNNLAFSIAFVVLLILSKNLIIITAGYFVLDVVVRGYFTWKEYRSLEMKGSPDPHMKLGHHMTGIGAVQTVALYINQILLQRFWGYSTLASFSVATLIPEQIKNATNSLSGVFLQRLSRHERSEKLTKVTQRHFWIGIAGTVGIIAAYMLAAPIMIPLFFPQYEDAVLPTIVYAIGLIGLPSIIGLYYYQAHNDIRRLWRFNTWNMVIQLTSSLILVPLYGNWGAIWSRVATRVTSVPLSYPLLPPQTKEKNEKKT